MNSVLNITTTRCLFEMKSDKKHFEKLSSLSQKFFEIQLKLKPEVSVEIGAFEATFSKLMKAEFPDINSVAFEANPYNYKHWIEKTNFKELGVKYEPLAISDVNGHITFNFQDTIKGEKISPVKGNNSIMQRNHVVPTTYRKEQVQSSTLDNYLNENNLEGKTICAWIDVEGASQQVLMGAEKSLENFQSIFIEVEHREWWQGQWMADDVQSFLESKGFVLLDKDGLAWHQENYLFVRETLIEKL